MNPVGGAARKLGRAAQRAATMTTDAAGAVGGAAVNGAIGGVKGVATGVQQGLVRGSHSTPAAALTLGALGAAGLVEWPVLLALGGAVLVLRQLNHQADGTATPAPAVPITRGTSAKTAKAAKAAKAAKSAGPRRGSPSKQTSARQSRGSQPRTRR